MIEYFFESFLSVTQNPGNPFLLANNHPLPLLDAVVGAQLNDLPSAQARCSTARPQA
jgi:hypothetical protein